MRPEHTAPPEIFYNVDEAQKYSRNTRVMEIQATMSERAIEMLNLKEDEPAFILDVGCGSGLSGECLDEQVRFLIRLIVISKKFLFPKCVLYHKDNS